MVIAWIVVVGLGALIGFGFVFWIRERKKMWGKVWEQVASAHTLTRLPSESTLQGPITASLVGAAEGREVAVSAWADEDGEYVSVLVTKAATGKLRLTLEREGVVGQLEKLLGAREIDTSDARFDRSYQLASGDPTLALALLGRRERQALLAGRPERVEIAEGVIQIQYRGLQWWRGRSPQRVPRLCTHALEAAKLLASRLEVLAKQPPKRRSTPQARSPLAARAVRPLLVGVALLGLLLVAPSVLDAFAQEPQPATRGRVVDPRTQEFGEITARIAWRRSAAARTLSRLSFSPSLKEDFARRQAESHAEQEQSDFEELRDVLALLREQGEQDELVQKLRAQARRHSDKYALADAPTDPEILEQVLNEVLGPPTATDR